LLEFVTQQFFDMPLRLLSRLKNQNSPVLVQQYLIGQFVQTYLQSFVPIYFKQSFLIQSEEVFEEAGVLDYDN